MNVKTMVTFICIVGMLSTVFLPIMTGMPQINSSRAAEKSNAATKELIIEENLQALSNFDFSTWQILSNAEKLDALQAVANIEAAHLGLPFELNVGAGILRDGVLGAYDERTRTIILSIDHLGSPLNALDTVAHESRHAYQHVLLDLLEESDEDHQNLLIFADVKKYLEEFANYSTDPETYSEQFCEIDASTYAKDRVLNFYLEYIHDKKASQEE